MGPGDSPAREPAAGPGGKPEPDPEASPVSSPPLPSTSLAAADPVPRVPSVPRVPPVTAADVGGRCRRWPWMVALVLLTMLAGAFAAVAWEQRETAAAWQSQAERRTTQRDEAVEAATELSAQVQVLSAELDLAAQRLSASEADVADLEGRLRELADDRAQAEDSLRTGEVERVFLQEIARGVAEAVVSLDDCVDRLVDLQQASVDAFNRAAAGLDVAVGPLNEQAEAVVGFCNEARSAAAAVGAAADAFGGR